MIPEIELEIGYYKLASKDLRKLREMTYEMEMKMTKSQNTKNEQLTEQWKKGEFIICNAGKCQYYYVQNEKQQEVIKTEYCLFDDNTPNWQILAEVPSYDEWKAAQEQINKDGVWYTEISHKKVLKENALLKELLKECKECIEWYKADCGYQDAPTNAVLAKIDEALRC